MFWKLDMFIAGAQCCVRHLGFKLISLCWFIQHAEVWDNIWNHSFSLQEDAESRSTVLGHASAFPVYHCLSPCNLIFKIFQPYYNIKMKSSADCDVNANIWKFFVLRSFLFFKSLLIALEMIPAWAMTLELIHIALRLNLETIHC